MKRQVASGLFSADGLCLAALLLVLATFQVNCANDNFESGKDQRPKGYYGLLKDLYTTKDKKSTSLLDDEGLRFRRAFNENSKISSGDLMGRNMLVRKSVLDGEGLRFKKGSSLLDDEGMRFRRAQWTAKERQEEMEKMERLGQLLSRLFPLQRRSDRSNRDILEGEGMRF